MTTQKVFLTAAWKKLIMANYEIEPSVLQPFLPAGTELDFFNNTCYISLVGFLFDDVKVKGLSLPGYKKFPEVNLRFYVKHFDGTEWKRGVVFISEIVPKRAISFIANTFYREHYSTLPMKYQWEKDEDGLQIRYLWKKNRKWNQLEVKTGLTADPLVKGSAAEFITEHFWGYAAWGKGKTAAYQVSHPGWDIYKVRHAVINCDFEGLYGPRFSFLTKKEPASVFLAEGSPVCVFSKKIV